MDKEQLLQELSSSVASGEVTRDEVVQRLGLAQLIQPAYADRIEIKESHHFSVTKMLYVLGAGVVVIGVLIFMAQVWDDMGAFGHILITLGLGLLVTLLGSMLLKQKPEASLGTVFHFIGGMLIPGGVIVTLDEMNLDTEWSFALIFVGVFVFYLILNAVHKNAVLTFFAIANGTAAIYLVSNALFDPILEYRDMEVLFQYVTIALGGSYMLLAYSFKDGWNNKLIGALNFFGITGLLGAAFIRVLDSGIWELFYFLVVFGALFLSVYMRSRIILIMSTIFLIVHITYITSEYFADSLGWPVALVLLGFMFIGLGYASITINKKYINEPQ
jgi:hypothetical protein